MLDIKLIRKHPEEIQNKLKTKQHDVDLSSIIQMDSSIRELKTHVEALKAKRNEFSERIGALKRKGSSVEEEMNQMSDWGKEIHESDQQLVQWEAQITDALSHLPNLPMDDITISDDPKDNVVIKEVGQKPHFDFPFKNHVELNERLKIFDFQRGAKLSGSGFPVYRGMGARLEWALLNYMLDVHLRNGFEQWMLPLLVHRDILFGSGQLPKFEGQQFRLDDEAHPLYMIPTAEIPLNGLHLGDIIPEEALPLRYVAYTPCFRREAGAAGSNERGLIRTHQFNKVEMFCFTSPEASKYLFEEMIQSAEEILQGLGLHYRNVLLVTGDMSFASARTVDIEAWLPGQNRYYEVSSVSNCTDYQARRSNIRFKRKVGGKPEFVHTLNGSGLATSRLMVALLENNQLPDGSVEIPQILHKYLGGIEKISPQHSLAFDP